MKKVVHLIHSLTMGGAETLVKDYCLLINKEQFEITVLCLNRENLPYESLLESSGIKVIYASDNLRNYGKKTRTFFGRLTDSIQRYYFISKILREINPDIVHSHLAINRYILISNLPKNTQIFHTVHNEPEVLWGKNAKFLGKLDFYVTKRLIKKYKFRFITLHETMRREVNALFDVSNTLVLNNGIFFPKYRRALPSMEIRKILHIPEDAFVIGHIGRMTSQKNHTFLLDVFAECCKSRQNSFLLMIGNGPLENRIRQKIQKLGLDKHTIILSNRTDIPDLLNAMNAFVFPSTFEGLGICLIEAQISKLKCIVSDKVPKAAQISNLVTFRSLSDPVSAWADDAMKPMDEPITYYNADEWNMECVVKKLEGFYLADV